AVCKADSQRIVAGERLRQPRLGVDACLPHVDRGIGVVGFIVIVMVTAIVTVVMVIIVIMFVPVFMPVAGYPVAALVTAQRDSGKAAIADMADCERSATRARRAVFQDAFDRT